MAKEKRYVATIEFYIYAESDIEAKEQMDKICKERKEQFDDQTSIVSLWEQPSGTLSARKVIDNE